MNNDVNALITGLLQLGLDITKSYKAHTGVEGAVKLVLNDPIVLASLEQVILHVADLPSEFKAMTATDGLSLIQPVFTGVEAIYTAAKA